MGTYTANYQLYMPSIGEQGWGDFMNGNLTTIDTTMKGLDTRVGTLETEMDAVEERVTALEAGEFETVNCAGTIEADKFASSTFIYNGLISQTEYGSPIATIKGVSKTGCSYSEFQNGIELGTLTFPDRAGLFVLSDDVTTESGNITITVTVHVQKTSYGCTGALLKDGVQYATITATNSTSASKQITIPYGDNSVWSCKYVSGELIGVNQYGMSISDVNLYSPM